MNRVEERGAGCDGICSRWFVAPAFVVASVLSLGCQPTEMTAPTGAVSQTVSQLVQDDTCDGQALPEATSAQDLYKQIEKEHRVVGLNRHALANLERDRRWQERDQHEPLQRAVLDTKGAIAMGEKKIEAAQCQLDALSNR